MSGGRREYDEGQGVSESEWVWVICGPLGHPVQDERGTVEKTRETRRDQHREDHGSTRGGRGR